jgi:hypothetical protein
MSLLDQLRLFPTSSDLADSLRAHNPGFKKTPELATLYSQSFAMRSITTKTNRPADSID